MALVIRPVESRDVDEVVALALRAWAPVHASMARVLGAGLNARIYPDWAASQAEDVRAAIDDAATSVAVAVDGDLPVGFVASVPHRDGVTGEVDMIAVDPARQREGIARLLMRHADETLRAAGCTLVVVATGGDDGHGPARALYEASGFTALPLVRYYREL